MANKIRQRTQTHEFHLDIKWIQHLQIGSSINLHLRIINKLIKNDPFKKKRMNQIFPTKTIIMINHYKVCRLYLKFNCPQRDTMKHVIVSS